MNNLANNNIKAINSIIANIKITENLEIKTSLSNQYISDSIDFIDLSSLKNIISLKNKMIDAPVFKRAQKIIELAIKSKKITKNWMTKYNEDD